MRASFVYVAGLTSMSPGVPGITPPRCNGIPEQLAPLPGPLAKLMAGAGAPSVPRCTESPPRGGSSARVPFFTVPLTLGLVAPLVPTQSPPSVVSRSRYTSCMDWSDRIIAVAKPPWMWTLVTLETYCSRNTAGLTHPSSCTATRQPR